MSATPGRRFGPVSRERWAGREGFHKTDSVDYAVVLERTVQAVLDEGETLNSHG